jgi:hypothetical protein
VREHKGRGEPAAVGPRVWGATQPPGWEVDPEEGDTPSPWHVSGKGHHEAGVLEKPGVAMSTALLDSGAWRA